MTDMTTTTPRSPVPVVDYLVLDDGPPYLVGTRCDGCGETYLGRRNACASCGGTAFGRSRLAAGGRVESFTIVVRGAPKKTGPFVSAVVRLDDGVYVKANLVGIEADAAAVDLDLPVRLTTFPAGTDEDGTEAIAFGFEYERGGVVTG